MTLTAREWFCIAWTSLVAGVWLWLMVILVLCFG